VPPGAGGATRRYPYDHFSDDRFRHGTKFLRWRPDKQPRACTFEQVRPARAADAVAGLGVAPPGARGA
jgi:ATP-dependent DNA ligase